MFSSVWRVREKLWGVDETNPDGLEEGEEFVNELGGAPPALEAGIYCSRTDQVAVCADGSSWPSSGEDSVSCELTRRLSKGRVLRCDAEDPQVVESVVCELSDEFLVCSDGSVFEAPDEGCDQVETRLEPGALELWCDGRKQASMKACGGGVFGSLIAGGLTVVVGDHPETRVIIGMIVAGSIGGGAMGWGLDMGDSLGQAIGAVSKGQQEQINAKESYKSSFVY